MATLSTDVLVIGGGATGAGVAWDAALRGYDVVLVDRLDLAEGTSGRFHGLLHSGGRYAVKDPRAAEECIAENRILKDDRARLHRGHRRVLRHHPVRRPRVRRRVRQGLPRHRRRLRGDRPGAGAARGAAAEPGYLARVPRARRQHRRLEDRVGDGARRPGARWARAALPRGRRHPSDGDQVTGARLRGAATGEEIDVEARVTVNASGAWAGDVAEMAGIEGVRVLPGRGIMIAMNHRLVNTCVNRCQMPTDGDIIVPIRTVCVIGTTDVHTDDPDDHTVLQSEVDAMLDDGEKLVPGFRQARALRVWTGVRPLFEDAKASDTDTRDVTRAHALLDHSQRDGVKGFVTITGGKLTTFRLMAEDTMNAVCRHLGDERPCTTKTEPLPGSEDGATYQLGERLSRKEANLADEQLICECELVPRWKLEEAIQRRATTNLDDIRRLLRLGMGPCQGGFCIYRATGILHGLDGLTAEQADDSLLHFLQERWKGVWPILYGDQLRQARLDDWIFQGVLDVEHLPREAASS